MTRRYRATCPKCIAAPEGMRHCHGECDEIKPLDEFHTDNAQPDGKTSCCKICNNKASTAYQVRMKAEDHEWEEREKARKAVWWSENWERFNFDRGTPEYRQAYNKMWREMPGHAASVQAYQQVRRARKAGAAINEPVNRIHLANMYDWTCMVEVCLHPDGRFIDPTLTYIDPATGRPNPWYLTTDHIVQVVDIGDNSYANTRPAHLRCNLSRPRGDAFTRRPVDNSDDICDNGNDDE